MSMSVFYHLPGDGAVCCSVDKSTEGFFTLSLNRNSGLDSLTVFARPEALLEIADRIYAEFGQREIEREFGERAA